MKKLLSVMLLIVLVVGGLIFVNSAHFGVVHATDVTGILSANATWTRANSPYTLTGPVAVNVGVTLTVEAGVMVNLNSFYIQVNGTLNARGVSTSIIQFGNGTLRFTPVSNGWNDNGSSGCIIEYASLTSIVISASNALKLNQDAIYGPSVTAGDSSVISGNLLSTSLIVGNFSKLTNNQIYGGINAGANCTLSNNVIGSGISAGDKSTVTGNTVEGQVFSNGNQSVITNNTIMGQVNGGVITNNTISAPTSFNVQGTTVSNNNITGGTVIATSMITNNIIISGNYTAEFRVFGGFTTVLENTPAIIVSNAGAPLISGNIITGGGIYASYFIFSGSTTLLPAIDLSSGGSATVSNNVIIGRSKLAINGKSYSISSNTAVGDFNGSASIVDNNTVQGSVTLNGGNPTISNNTVSGGIFVHTPSCNISGNTANGISATQSNSYVSDNIVKNGAGISVTGGGTIVRNLISNNTSAIPFINGTSIVNGTVGISVTNGTVLILNNTISENGVGILLNSVSSGTQIHYNNIQSNTQSIVIAQGTNNIDATSNWWGTTNTQAINQTIHDFENDFNLGNVVFTPFLTVPNTQALPNPTASQPPVIPETFPPWISLALLVIAALAAAATTWTKCKQRTRSQSQS